MPTPPDREQPRRELGLPIDPLLPDVPEQGTVSEEEYFTRLAARNLASMTPALLGEALQRALESPEGQAFIGVFKEELTGLSIQEVERRQEEEAQQARVRAARRLAGINEPEEQHPAPQRESRREVLPRAAGYVEPTVLSPETAETVAETPERRGINLRELTRDEVATIHAQHPDITVAKHSFKKGRGAGPGVVIEEATHQGLPPFEGVKARILNILDGRQLTLDELAVLVFDGIDALDFTNPQTLRERKSITSARKADLARELEGTGIAIVEIPPENEQEGQSKFTLASTAPTPEPISQEEVVSYEDVLRGVFQRQAEAIKTDFDNVIAAYNLTPDFDYSVEDGKFKANERIFLVDAQNNVVDKFDGYTARLISVLSITQDLEFAATREMITVMFNKGIREPELIKNSDYIQAVMSNVRNRLTKAGLKIDVIGPKRIEKPTDIKTYQLNYHDDDTLQVKAMRPGQLAQTRAATETVQERQFSETVIGTPVIGRVTEATAAQEHVEHSEFTRAELFRARRIITLVEEDDDASAIIFEHRSDDEDENVMVTNDTFEKAARQLKLSLLRLDQRAQYDRNPPHIQREFLSNIAIPERLSQRLDLLRKMWKESLKLRSSIGQVAELQGRYGDIFRSERTALLFIKIALNNEDDFQYVVDRDLSVETKKRRS